MTTNLKRLLLYCLLPTALAIVLLELYATLFPHEFARYGWQTENTFSYRVQKCADENRERQIIAVIGDSHGEFHGYDSPDNLVFNLNKKNSDPNIHFCNFSLSGQGLEFYISTLHALRETRIQQNIIEVIFLYSEANDFSHFLYPYNSTITNPANFDRKLNYWTNIVKKTYALNFLWRQTKQYLLPSRYDSLDDWIKIKQQFPFPVNTAEEAFERYRATISNRDKALFNADKMNTSWLELAMFRPDYMEENFGLDKQYLDEQLRGTRSFLSDVNGFCSASGVTCRHIVVPMSYYNSDSSRKLWVDTFGFNDCRNCLGPINVITKINKTEAYRIFEYPVGVLGPSDFFDFDEHLRGTGNQKLSMWILSSED